MIFLWEKKIYSLILWLGTNSRLKVSETTPQSSLAHADAPTAGASGPPLTFIRFTSRTDVAFLICCKKYEP